MSTVPAGRRPPGSILAGPVPVMRTAIDARRPCTRASTLASPGAHPQDGAVPRHLGDECIGAPEGEAAPGIRLPF